jgi:hypothetical protein
MGKISEIEKRQALIEAEMSKRKMKPFKLPGKATKAMRQVRKMPDHIVTQYLGQDGSMKFKICRVVSGNIIVVNDKAHKINPKDIWRYGRNTWYIHREISRNAVSNQDYETVRDVQKASTENDKVLIKAVLGAIQKPKKEMKKGVVMWIIIAAVALILGLIFFGGGGGAA